MANNNNVNRPTSMVGDILLFAIFVFVIMLIFGLPIIIYYTNYNSQHRISFTNDATSAFILLAIGCMGWLAMLVIFIYLFFFRTYKKIRHLRYLLDHGKNIQGSIINSNILRSGKNEDIMQLDVTFKNLANAEVTETLSIVDSKPELNRFGNGKRIDLVVDPNVNHPSIMIRGNTISWNMNIVIIGVISILLILSIGVGLLIWGYLKESHGYGWRYLNFGHPFVLIPIIGLALLLFVLFVSKMTFDKKSTKLLIYGKQAVAIIKNVRSTGVEINGKPQGVINLSFEDEKGKTHKVNVKKTFDVFNMQQITPGNSINILYDVNNPKDIELIA